MSSRSAVWGSTSPASSLVMASVIGMATPWSWASLAAAGVVRTQRFRGVHLAQVLGLVERYDADDVLSALERAIRYDAYDGKVVERIVTAQAEPRSLPDTLELAAARRLAEVARQANVEPRSLDDYAAALGPKKDCST